MSRDFAVRTLVAEPRSLAERVSDLNQMLHTRRIETAGDLDELYRLRYRCYTKEGSIEGVLDGRFVDEYDHLPNTHNIGLYHCSELIAAIRIAVLAGNDDRSASMRSFGDLIGPIVARGETVIDPSRFVIDHDFSRSNPEIPYLVTRIPFMAGGYFQASTVLATVRSEHMAFYKRVLRCEKVADPRRYLGLTTPLNLMMANYPISAPKVISRYPSFAYNDEDASVLFGGSAESYLAGSSEKLKQVA